MRPRTPYSGKNLTHVHPIQYRTKRILRVLQHPGSGHQDGPRSPRQGGSANQQMSEHWIFEKSGVSIYLWTPSGQKLGCPDTVDTNGLTPMCRQLAVMVMTFMAAFCKNVCIFTFTLFVLLYCNTARGDTTQKLTTYRLQSPFTSLPSHPASL